MPGALTVAITTPGETAYTNGTVHFSVTVTGGDADSVELLADATSIASLHAPYAFDWDTKGHPEGKVQVIARATRAGVQLDSAPRLVVVDRTAPTVLARVPAPGAASVAVGDPITIALSEPLLVDTVKDATVALSDGAAPIATTVSLSADGTTVKIKPTPTIVAPISPTATLMKGMTDLAGNALVLPADPWQWTAPYWLPLGDVAVQPKGAQTGVGVDVALDKNGAPCTLLGT